MAFSLQCWLLVRAEGVSVLMGGGGGGGGGGWGRWEVGYEGGGGEERER